MEEKLFFKGLMIGFVAGLSDGVNMSQCRLTRHRWKSAKRERTKTINKGKRFETELLSV